MIVSFDLDFLLSRLEMLTLFGKLDCLTPIEIMSGYHGHHLLFYLLVVCSGLVTFYFTQLVHVDFIRAKVREIDY